MLKLQDKQVSLLEKSVERDFIKRMMDIIQFNNNHLVENLTTEEAIKVLYSCLNEARSIHIENEQDVFDYSLIRLEQRENILEMNETKEITDWLNSKFVPPHRKVEELKTVFFAIGKE